MQNLSDSLLFLGCARTALRNIVENSEMEKEDMNYLSNFIMNEATDYQVMSMLITDEVPTEKHNAAHEAFLFGELKEMILFDYASLSEGIDGESLNSVLWEVGPISEHGLTSAVPILEHLVQSGALASILAEKAISKKQADAFGAQVTQQKNVAKQANKTATALASAGKGAGKNVGSSPNAVQAGMRKHGLDPEGLKKRWAGAKKAVKSIPGQVKGDIDQARANFKTGSKFQGKGRSAYDAGKQLAKSKTGKGAGAAAVASLALYAGVKAYKRFISAAGRACAGKSGAANDACVKAYKSKGVKAQISATAAGASKCSSSKNPAKCKQAVQAKLASLRSKV